MRIEQDLTEVPAWEGGGILGPGVHHVEIEGAVEGRSSGGHPQIEIDYATPDGTGRIREWLVITEKTWGKFKALIEATGLPMPGAGEEFNPTVLCGRRLGIIVADERDQRDPTKMRSRVQGYKPASEVAGVSPTATGNGSAQDDEIPF